MADHDQRFKTLLREFFEAFFQLFFPTWAEWFDFEHITWLDKEVFVDPPQGTRRVLDVVAQLPTRREIAGQRPGQPASWVALIHVEIDSSESVEPLRGRMYDYYKALRDRHGLPVLPVGLYLKVGLNGVGVDVFEERFGDWTVLHFEYLYVGLPALDAKSYVHGDNWLGVALAGLMRVKQQDKIELRAEALERIWLAPENTYRRFLLSECIQAYMPLDQAEEREFDRLIDTKPYPGVKAMATTWYDHGMEKGMQLGLQQGELHILVIMLESQFGPIDAETRKRIESMSPDQREDLAKSLLRASSLSDLGLDDSP